MKEPHNSRRRLWGGFCLAGSLCGMLAAAGCVAGTRNRVPEPVPPTPTEQEMLRRLEQLEVSLRQIDEQVRRANAELGAQIVDVKEQVQAVNSKVTSQERLLNRAATAMSAFGRGVPVVGPVLPGLPGAVPGGEAEPGMWAPPATGSQLGASAAPLGPATPPAGPPGEGQAGAAYPDARVSPPAVRPGEVGSEARGVESRAREELQATGDRETAGGDPTPEGMRRYETAYRDLQRENYQLALMNFRSFLAEFPQTHLSDNAQYWVGEIYYAQGQFNQAVDEFRRVVDDYPGQDKVPAAYYKIALCFINLRDTATARRYLISLLERFPEAQEARMAEEKLAEL